MIPVVGMFRGLFLGSVLVWYSSNVWKTMDNYYNQEFKKYLQKEKAERRFPSEEEVCRALPTAPCPARDAGLASDDPAADARVRGGGVEKRAGEEDALAATTAPLTGASGCGREDDAAGGGCTVSRDVTHTGEWSRHQEAEDSGEKEADVVCRTGGQEQQDDGDTCPANW